MKPVSKALSAMWAIMHWLEEEQISLRTFHKHLESTSSFWTLKSGVNQLASIGIWVQKRTKFSFRRSKRIEWKTKEKQRIWSDRHEMIRGSYEKWRSRQWNLVVIITTNTQFLRVTIWKPEDKAKGFGVGPLFKELWGPSLCVYPFSLQIFIIHPSHAPLPDPAQCHDHTYPHHIYSNLFVCYKRRCCLLFASL